MKASVFFKSYTSVTEKFIERYNNALCDSYTRRAGVNWKLSTIENGFIIEINTEGTSRGCVMHSISEVLPWELLLSRSERMAVGRCRREYYSEGGWKRSESPVEMAFGIVARKGIELEYQSSRGDWEWFNKLADFHEDEEEVVEDEEVEVGKIK